MDKLRLSLLGPDFARLYSDNSGFNGCRETISFPSNRPLLLTLVAVRQYQLTVEGDAVLQAIDDADEPDGRLFSVNWADSAKRNASGIATLTIANPDMPDQPFIFALSLGAFAYVPAVCPQAVQHPVADHEQGALVAQMLLSDQAEADAAAERLLQEHPISWFGNVVVPGFWDEWFAPKPVVASATN